MVVAKPVHSVLLPALVALGSKTTQLEVSALHQQQEVGFLVASLQTRLLRSEAHRQVALPLAPATLVVGFLDKSLPHQVYLEVRTLQVLSQVVVSSALLDKRALGRHKPEALVVYLVLHNHSSRQNLDSLFLEPPITMASGREGMDSGLVEMPITLPVACLVVARQHLPLVAVNSSSPR